jgi:hypothetical protein
MFENFNSTKQLREEGSLNNEHRPKAGIALLVLGMHRSGTSALTRILSLLGADLPRNLCPPDAGNPTGYWESMDWISLHEEFLAAHGLSPDSPRTLPAAAFQADKLAPFRERLVSLLRDNFANSPLFVAKDPRICRLVPLWQEALQELGFSTRHVLIVRHPMEVAASLAARDGVQQKIALLLWVRHLLEAERASRGKPRIFVSYAALLQNWCSVANRIAAAFNFKWPVSPAAAQTAIEDFINRQLRHHTANTDSNMAGCAWVKALYDASSILLEDETAPSGIAAFDAVGRQLAASDDFLTPVLLMVEAKSGESAYFSNECIRLRAEMTPLAARVSSQDAEIARLTAKIQRLELAVKTAEEEVAERNIEVEGKSKELNSLGQEAQDLLKQLNEREWQLHLAKMRIQSIKGSLSWKLTRPLRRIFASLAGR